MIAVANRYNWYPRQVVWTRQPLTTDCHMLWSVMDTDFRDTSTQMDLKYQGRVMPRGRAALRIVWDRSDILAVGVL